MIQKQKRVLTIILKGALSLLALSPLLSRAANMTYTPMEEIPGFGKPEDFPGYVIAVFKFGIWTAGISAMLMIMVGGYMYMTSAGNNASMEKAKGIITDAIIGLILALFSWLLLYTINPELVSIKIF